MHSYRIEFLKVKIANFVLTTVNCVGFENGNWILWLTLIEDFDTLSSAVNIKKNKIEKKLLFYFKTL